MSTTLCLLLHQQLAFIIGEEKLSIRRCPMRRLRQQQARRASTSPVWAAVAATILTVLATFALPSPSFAKEQPQKSPPQIGRFVHVMLPITGQTFERTRRIVGRAKEKAKRRILPNSC